MPGRDRIRVGVVGANPRYGWGAQAHVPAFKALPEYELLAVCTSRPETASEAAQAFGVPFAYHDYHDLVENPDIDLVSVAVKVPYHAELALAAIEAGKHVFCEWPLAANTVEAQAMLDAARRHGVRHAVCLQARLSPTVLYMKELIEAGYIGKPQSCAVTHFAPFAGGRGRTTEGAWAARRAAGANMLTIRTGHDIDMLRFCLGEFGELAADVETLAPWKLTDTGQVIETDVPDSIIVSGRLINGMTSSLHIGGHLGPGSGWRMEVYGSEGTLVATSPGLVQWASIRLQGGKVGEALADLAAPDRLRWAPAEVSPLQPYNVAQLLRRFAQSIHDGADIEPNFETALSLHQLLDNIQRASDSRSRLTF